MIILETERLLLREITSKDAPDFFKLNNDPEVIKYTGDKAFKSIRETELFLDNYKDYLNYGYGRWAVIAKDSKLILGWCGLKYTAGLNETDIGFRFFKKYWNQGFATEAASSCITYGFDKLKLKIIYGKAMKENIASIKVLEKIGMTYWKDQEFELHPGVYYKTER
jgi:[ribosomal protein S5]-alanine N-acetyltransferase